MITLEGLKPLPSARKFLTRLMSIWGWKHQWFLRVCVCVCVCVYGFACDLAYFLLERIVFQWNASNVQFPAKRPEIVVHLASIKNNWDLEALGWGLSSQLGAYGKWIMKWTGIILQTFQLAMFAYKRHLLFKFYYLYMYIIMKLRYEDHLRI